MSVGYAAVGWNRFKERHDLVLFGSIVAWLGSFLGVSLALEPAATQPADPWAAVEPALFSQVVPTPVPASIVP